jgi:BirA family biotin operon repressor/biotin-[acetyl-CoA-carboxylase] ligase
MGPGVRLEELLRARGLEWPAPIEHQAVVGSTNDLLKERARAGAPEWSAVWADRQTAGRGRQGHSWASPSGNLYLSVLLRPSLPADSWSVLPLAAGVAVCEAALELGVAAELKWPNDVLVAGRKLAGVLVEAVSGAGGIESAIVGVGVNVATVPEELPGELAGRITSLAAERGAPVDLLAFAAAVLTRLTVCYDALAREGAAAIVQRWRQLAAAWWGSVVEVESAGEIRRGVARGVDGRGAFLLEDASGRVQALLSGEAREVRRFDP